MKWNSQNNIGTVKRGDFGPRADFGPPRSKESRWLDEIWNIMKFSFSYAQFVTAFLYNWPQSPWVAKATPVYGICVSVTAASDHIRQFSTYYLTDYSFSNCMLLSVLYNSAVSSSVLFRSKLYYPWASYWPLLIETYSWQHSIYITWTASFHIDSIFILHNYCNTRYRTKLIYISRQFLRRTALKTFSRRVYSHKALSTHEQQWSETTRTQVRTRKNAHVTSCTRACMSKYAWQGRERKGKERKVVVVAG